MSPSSHGPDEGPPNTGAWLGLPPRNGRVLLVSRAELVDSNPLGFSVESLQRILVPHVYVIELDSDSPQASTSKPQATAFATPVSGRAVWCHLLGGQRPKGGSRPVYRAGFELVEPRLDSVTKGRSTPKKPDWSQRRVERATQPRLPLRLEASANIQLLSRAANPATRRLRFSSTLLPSLSSRVRIEIASEESSTELVARVVDVGPLRPDSGMPRSWLEVEVEKPSESAFDLWIDREAR